MNRSPAVPSPNPRRLPLLRRLGPVMAALGLGATLVTTTALAPLNWGDCGHHFNIFAEPGEEQARHGAESGDHEEGAPNRRPATEGHGPTATDAPYHGDEAVNVTGEAVAPRSPAAPGAHAAHGEPGSHGDHGGHGSSGSHDCLCGDLGCSMAGAGSFPWPTAQFTAWRPDRQPEPHVEPAPAAVLPDRFHLLPWSNAPPAA